MEREVVLNERQFKIYTACNRNSRGFLYNGERYTLDQDKTKKYTLRGDSGKKRKGMASG